MKDRHQDIKMRRGGKYCAGASTSSICGNPKTFSKQECNVSEYLKTKGSIPQVMDSDEISAEKKKCLLWNSVLS